MKLIFLFLFIFLAATVLAALEIQIEGKYGWASRLPTFRLKKKIGEKPITGYHLFILLFTLLIFHFPCFFTAVWTFKKEAMLLGAWILMWSLEDFLWFVLNPHYGLARFNDKNKDLWWHKSWLLGLPTFYWLGFPAGVLLISLGI